MVEMMAKYGGMLLPIQTPISTFKIFKNFSQDISTFTSVPSDGVRLGVGVSNGGAFAITAGGVLSFTAVTSLCGVGQEMVFSQTQTPTQWLMCDNDTNETVSGKTRRMGKWYK